MSGELAPANESAKGKRFHNESTHIKPLRDFVRSNSRCENRIDSPSSRAPSAENPDRPALSSLSEPNKQVKHTAEKRRDRISRRENPDPKRFKEEMVSWCADSWLARARVVYTNGDIDGTSLWSPNYGQEESDRGFNIFDGFEQTWYVPTEDSSPLPESRKDIQDRLEERCAAMRATYAAETDTNFMNRVRGLLEEEADKKCQSEWDGNMNNAAEPPMEWSKVKSTVDFFPMVKMVAKARLLEGNILLPEYYRISILELTTDGKLLVRQFGMPRGADLKGVRLRLDAWSPTNDDQTQQTLDTVTKKVNAVFRHGTDVGKKKASLFLKEMKKPVLDPLGEGGAWLYKLQVKENYSLPAGKGPGKMSTWPGLKDEESLNTLIEGAKQGKNVVLARQWKIRLRRMWPQLDQLEGQVVSATAGEPQLTDEQFGILDQLLANQSREEKEDGNRLAYVLNAMEKPTHKPSFADEAQ